MSVSSPNILLLMADQLAAPALPFYGNKVARTPALAALAARSVIFDAAYCNFPICAPSRYSMLTGQLPHAISAFDNACEMPSELPTMAHYLGAAGYHTILAGKMHFVGPDQLHGFDERLTTDIYPSEFLWVPDWSQGPGYRPTGVGMGHVVDAGPCLRNMQIDYDEEVEHVAVQKIYDLARQGATQPFFLTVSFTHPHPPFVASQEYWDAYADVEIDPPAVPEIPYEQLDPHSQWLYLAHAQDRHRLTPERIQRARRAYYAMASYVDEKIGRVVAALGRSGLKKNTIIVFCSDHGEMLGERGMWFKQTFYEWSARVPLLVAQPDRQEPCRRASVCSLVDLLPTFLDLAAAGGEAGVVPVERLAGRSLVPLLNDATMDDTGEAISEYSSEGVCAPSRMVRRGPCKYVYTLGLPPMLFDLEKDPLELRNFAGEDNYKDIESALRNRLLEDWNPDDVNDRILQSQRRRLFLRAEAKRKGKFPAWTYEAREGDAERFVRSTTHGGAIGAKPRSRFPFVSPTPPELPPREN